MLRVETLHLTSDRDRPQVPRGVLTGRYVVVALAAVGAGFGAWLVARTGAVGLAFGVLVVLILALACIFAVLATSAQRRGRLVVDQHPGSLRLPGASSTWSLVVALLGLTTLLAVGAVVVAGVVLVQAEVDFTASAVGGAVILLGLTVMLALVVVQVLRGRIRSPYLDLGPDGLTYHGPNASTTVLWEDVTGLRLVADPGRRLVVESRGTPQRTVRSATPGERPVGGPRIAPGEVSLPAAFLGSDVAVVADLVQDLVGNPRENAGVSAELRAGLATGATLALLRRRSAGASG